MAQIDARARRRLKSADEHLRQGRHEQAEADFVAALKLVPEHPEALIRSGALAILRGAHDAAVARLERAIRVRPEIADAHYHLGTAYACQDRLEAAEARLRHALHLKPDYVAAAENLANVLVRTKRSAEAVAAARLAVSLGPGRAESHVLLGQALELHGELEEAADVYRHALNLNPAHAVGWSNLGTVLVRLHNVEAAVAAYRQAILLQPEYANAHSNLGLALLLQGNFDEGWPEQEWRAEGSRGARAGRYAQRYWRGEDISGRRLLLYAEQGYGDAIQFFRYVALAAQRGARVIVECPPELKRLFAGAGGIESIVGRSEPLPEFDVRCPLFSLPLAFGTRLDTVPRAVPYLSADPGLAAHFAARVAATGNGFRVGITWAGSATYASAKMRGCNPADFAAFAELPGVTCYSLQKGPAAAQARAAFPALIDLTGEIADFADTAALIANLDLVVSVDTAVLHLAGALGKPVWQLARHEYEWRWLIDREDSPWYPTMRIFRQPARGDWDPVFRRVCNELARVAAQQAGTAAE